MGRYVERIEHLSRYINAQYLSSSDTPGSPDKSLMLESMLYMAYATASFNAYSDTRSADRVIFFLTLEPNNPASILNYVGAVRENARGVRDHITTELWESVNRYYHDVNTYTKERISRKGPYEFCKSTMDTTMLIKGVADSTLLRNEVWSMFRAGTHLERALQITQILRSKLNDASKTQGTIAESMNGQHWTALLRSAGSLDMSRHYYGTTPNQEKAYDFLVLNRKSPKSVLYNLERIRFDLEIISGNRPIVPESVEFSAGKLASKISFLTVKEILNEGSSFFDHLIDELVAIGAQLEQQYLTF
ncbi:Uncharacterized conserved protein, Alpha-E superfamily [Catalinimonas alkaloidigena]|uniref:Uncharacterized conserved protein, Alpha-E superfamily n=2 Tax=Catalinimonas alkaloidigena TaxID=1075417 RepID=A0A1G9SBH2_9BACT|nr:Uncharacterized conserved protein, Alpha-E superfamily [Catalinimonas alkaloidigena]